MAGCRWRVFLGLVAVALLVQTVFIAAPGAQAAGEPAKNPSWTMSLKDGTKASLATTFKSGVHYVPGQVIVEFAPGTTTAAMNQTISGVGAEAVRVFPGVAPSAPRAGQGIAYSVAKSSSLSVEELVAKFRGMKGVVAVSPDYIRKTFSAPNDPKFSQQWGLLNTGQEKGTAGADIDAVAAWSYTTGSKDVVLADIDTGAMYTHPDLVANMWHNPGEIADDGIDNDRNGYKDDIYGIDAADGDSDPMDGNGHGTHTAGIMAAAGNNALGISGVNWHVKVMALQFLDAEGYGSDSGALECIDYIIAMKARGVNIAAINASWGGEDDSTVLKDAVAATGDAGIVWCGAAGNYGDNNEEYPEYPASWDLPNIVSVAATDRLDHITGWSNYGKSSVDLGAPGEAILSTVPDYTTGPAVFADNAEKGVNGWTAAAPWALTTELAKSPTHSWTDSPGGNYANNLDLKLTSPVMDLTSAGGPVELTFQFEYDFDEESEDYLLIEFSADGGKQWDEFGGLSGSGGKGKWYLAEFVLFEEFLTDEFRVRFTLHTDGAGTAGGVHLDDFRVGEAAPGYAAWDGTSMATPFVTGTVGLLAAISPTDSVDSRVDALLMTTDPLASLKGKCVTGGRLNAGAAAKFVKLAPKITVSTIAGANGVPGRSDGTGKAARFYYPQGVCADPATGNLYVVDWNNHTIRKVTPAGVVTTLAGSAGRQGSADGTGAAARFNFPCGICFDPVDNALYVADRGNNVIRRVTKAGVVTTVAGVAGQAGSADGAGSLARFDKPTGICYDLADGNLYVTDQGNATIRRVSPQGVVRTIAGRPGTPGTSDGGRSTGRFDSPTGICYNPMDQNVYITESEMNTIRRLTPGGVVVTVAGAAGQTGRRNGAGSVARFSSPVDICYNPGDQKLYIVDSGNHLIRQMTTKGAVGTFAGVAGFAQSVDGMGSIARLCYPRNICYNPFNGRLYETEDAMVLRQIAFGQRRDAAPVITLGAAAAIANGETFTRTVRFADSDSIKWAASVDYGDGSGSKPLALAADKTMALSHAWATPGSYIVKVTVVDDAGVAGSGTLVVTVKDAAPVVKAGPDAVAREDTAFTRSGSFSDGGGGPWTASVNYGDGTGTVGLVLAADKSFKVSHVFYRPGVYTVTIVVNDGTAKGTDTFVVGVASRYQQTNEDLTYAGTWKTVPATGASGGDYKQAGASGSAVTIAFTGRGFELISRKGPDCGIAKVTLDGGTPVRVDLYASAAAFQKSVWSTGLLAQGDHTVRIEWTGDKRAAATAANINLDAVYLVGTLR